MDVGGAFRWVTPGDVGLLDGDHGFLVVNPSRAEVAAERATRRDEEIGPSAPLRSGTREGDVATMPQKPQARAKDKRRLTKRLAKWRAKQEREIAPVEPRKHPQPL